MDYTYYIYLSVLSGIWIGLEENPAFTIFFLSIFVSDIWQLRLHWSFYIGLIIKSFFVLGVWLWLGITGWFHGSSSDCSKSRKYWKGAGHGLDTGRVWSVSVSWSGLIDGQVVSCSSGHTWAQEGEPSCVGIHITCEVISWCLMYWQTLDIWFQWTRTIPF